MIDAFPSLLALFLSAFPSATILPGTSEAVFAALALAGKVDWALLLALATVGNVLGSCVNWGLGRMVSRFSDRSWFPVGPAALARAERWYRRYGVASLLLSWAPVIGDALTVASGVLRTPFWLFLALVTVAKGARYAAILALLL